MKKLPFRNVCRLAQVMSLLESRKLLWNKWYVWNLFIKDWDYFVVKMDGIIFYQLQTSPKYQEKSIANVGLRFRSVLFCIIS